MPATSSAGSAAMARDSNQLGKLDVLIAQLESMAASFSSQQHLDPLICFDLLADLLWTIDEESKERVLACQRKCEDALQNLLLLGVRPPVRHLAASAIAELLTKGDSISIYSRASGILGWLADAKKAEPASLIGAAQCLGTLYKLFGPKITSNLAETSTVVNKLMKSQEVTVRQAAMQLLHDTLEGCGGIGPWAAYSEALRTTTKWGVADKSVHVKATAAGCLRLFGITGGPGFSPSTLESCASLCLKGLEDACQSVQDGFAAALGTLLALGLNPHAQIQQKGKGATHPPKPLEGGLGKFLITPFLKASGSRCKDIRVGVTMAWVVFLQEMRLSYSKNDEELGAYVIQVLDMLPSIIDPHAQACVMYILRVGIVDQMGETGQKELVIMLCKQLGTSTTASMLIVTLRTLSHLLITLGEVSPESRDALDSALVSTICHASVEVRIEAALTLRGLAEVDVSSASSLMSCAITTLWALHETVAFEKGDRLRIDLAAFHGQAAMLASLLASLPKLPLGLPSRLPLAVLDLGKKLVSQSVRNPLSASFEKEAGWMLISAFVSSMPFEELAEKESEILPVWIGPFGGSVHSMINPNDPNLSAEISGWSAAVEALAAFIKNDFMSRMAPEREGTVFQSVLKYLSGALSCLSSTVLQQAPQSLKPTVDVFTIKILRAFRTLASPTMYRNQHSVLLRICTTPFRQPAGYDGSSCLRQLLDGRDASLGPWLPGRDSFEDELRAFEGAANGLLPCVSDDAFVFPQAVAMEVTLVDEMMMCLGTLFGAQPEVTKLQLLEVLEASIKASKKQNWYYANLTNICVSLLGSLKKTIPSRSQDAGEVVKRIQAIFQDILADETSILLHRRAAAEGLGYLARMGGDIYAARLMRSLLTDIAGSTDPLYKSSIAFALGSIHRSVGGMTLSALVPSTITAICSMIKDAKDGLPIWSLHGLTLTIEAAGLSFVPHVQATLSVVTGLLLSEDHNSPELRESIGRIINAIVAVLGPELSPGKSLFSRCKSIVSVVSSGEEPAALLEGVWYTQQLVLFAPQALSVHFHVETLLPTLFSKQPSLRQAAISTIRHLCERDPMAMIAEEIEEDLFSMLDTETDAQIIRTVRLTLERLLEGACPSSPSRWIQICRRVLASAKPDVFFSRGPGDLFEDDEEGMIGSKDKPDIRKDGDHLPRYKTRVFAAECLSRIPSAVGSDPLHFNIVLAKEQLTKASGDYLVLRLGELVALAFQVATGEMESMRPIGVALLDTILEKFEKAEDPDPEYAGHLLLEQYQAQFLSAVRTALEPSAGPLLMAAGARLAARIVTSGVAGGDRGVLQRVVNLISRPLSKWESLDYAFYAEWVGCKVKAGLLGAHAAVKTYALACVKSGEQKFAVGHLLLSLLASHIDVLNRSWIGLLKDYSVFCMQLSANSQTAYSPFLKSIESPAIALKLQPYLYEVSALILEAVAVDALPANDNLETESSVLKPALLSARDFLQIWALATILLTDSGPQISVRNKSTRSFPSFKGRIVVGGVSGTANLQLVSLRALGCLCSKRFYSQSMLSLDVCHELLLILRCPAFQGHSWAPMAILSIVDKVVDSAPDSYFQSKDIVFAAADVSISFLTDLLHSDATGWKTYEADGVVCSSLTILGRLISRSSSEMQASLVPQLFCLGLKALNLSSLSEDVLSAVLALIMNLAAVASDTSERALEHFPLECKCTVLASVIESLAQITPSTRRLPLVLGSMVGIARMLPADEATKHIRHSAQVRCISQLRDTWTTGESSARLAVLQTLRAALQTGVAEQAKGVHYAWALLLMHELGTCIIDVLAEAPSTSEGTTVAGESLKLLLLLHSLVVVDEAQRGVMHVLLKSIACATATTTALTGLAVQLVTQLASVPATAAQFKAALVELTPEARAKLQDIIRSSVATSTIAPGPIRVPNNPNPITIAQAQSPETEEEEEEEWDDFQ